MSGRRTNPGRKLGSTRRLRQNVHHLEVAEEEQEPHAKPEKDIPTEANSQGAANVKENAAALNTIQEIFHDCDTEAKGFITRADMQKLAADLPLTSEELEQVFQSLDREGNGFITNEDFSEGLRKFMETPSVMSEGRPKDEEASTHVASVDINVRGFSTSQKRRKVGSSRRQPRTINPEGWLGTLAEETTDGSGIITHGDLQRLAGSLQLDFKDLQVVFDHLDHERHGFVTTEDFLKGLKQFLGKQPQLKDMQKKMEPSLYQSPVPDFLEEVDSEEKKHFLGLMESLGADNLLQDQTEIWKLWTELRYREPHLLENLEEFVAKVTLQIRQAQEEKESLELTLKKRIIDHNQEVQQLYEEMEHQIIQERERLRSERFKTSEAQAKHLRKALDQKNCEVHHLTKVQNELEESVQVLLNSKNKTSSENEELRRTNQELERQLEGIRGQLQQTKDRVQDMCSSMTRRQAGEAPEEHQPIQPLLGGSAVAQEPKECRRDNSKSSELLEEKESRRVPVVSKDEGPALIQHTNENTPTGRSSQGRATQDTRLSQAQLLNSSGDDSLPDLIADSASSTMQREEKEKETRKKSKEEDEGQTVENLQAEEGEALQEEERARQQTWDTVAKGGQDREGDPTEDGQKGVGRKTEDDRNRWQKDKEGVGELLEAEENKQGWEQEPSGKEINNDRKEQRWDVEEKLEDNSDIREEELEQDREETNGREDKHQTSEMEAELTEQGEDIHWAQKVDEVIVEGKNSNEQYSKQDKAHTEQEEGQTTAIVKETAGSPKGSMQEKQDRCVDSEGKVLKQEYLAEDVWSKGNEQGGKSESIIHMSEAETVMEEKIYREEGEVKVINTDQEEASQNGDKTETVDDPAYTDSKQVNISQGLISAEQEGLLVRVSVNQTQQDGFKGNVEELPKENEMSSNKIDEPNDRGQLLDSITEESSSKTKSDHLKEEHRMQGDKEPFKQKVQSEEGNEETSNMLHSVMNEDQFLRKESIEDNQEVPSSEVMEIKIKMHLEEGKQLKYNLKEELQATKEERQEEINTTREGEHKDELKPAYIRTTMSYEETTLRDVMQINVDLRNEGTVVKRNDEFLETETEENIVEERDEDHPAQGKGQEKRVTFLLETEGKFRKNEDVTKIVVAQTTVHKDEAEVSSTQGGEQSQEEENVRYWVEGMYPVEQKGEIQVGETENLKAEERKLHSKDEGLEIDRVIHQNERGEGMESEETDNRRNIQLLGQEVVEHGNDAGGDEEHFDKKLCKLNNSISNVDVIVMDNTQQADQVGLMGLQSSTIQVWEEWNAKNNLSNQEAFQDLTYNSGEQGNNRQLELNIPTAHIAQNEDGVMKILSDREQKDGVETNEDTLQKGDEEWKGDPFKDVETNITKDNLKEGNEQNKRTIHGEDGSGFLKEMEEISNEVYGVKDIQDNDECKNKAEMHYVRFGRNKDDKTELQEEREEDTFRDGQGNAMENGEDRNDGLLQEGDMCKKRMDLQDDWKGVLILDEEAIHHSTVYPTEGKTDEEIKDGVNSSEAALGLDEEQQERKLGKLIINIADSNNYKKMKETNEDINNGEDSNGIKSSQCKNEKQEADLDKEIDTINKTDQEEEKWIKDGVVESNKKQESRLLEQLEEGTHEHVEINTKEEEEINEKETYGLNVECKEEIQTIKKSDKENEESNLQDGIYGYSTEKIISETDTREEESEEINEDATHGLKEEWGEEIQTIKKSENHEEHEETNEQVGICEYTSENINGLLKQEWECQGSMLRIEQTNISNNEDHNSTECEDKLNSVKSEILMSNETNKTNFEDNEVTRKESKMESDIDLKWAELESDKLVKYNTHILTYDTPEKGGTDSSSHLWDQTEWEDTQGFKVYSKQEIKVLSGHDKIEKIFQVTMGRDDIAAEELEIQQEEAEKVVVCMEIPGMTEDTLDDQITVRIAADEQGEEAFWREDDYKKAEANRPENEKNGSLQMEKGFSKQPGDAVILLDQSTKIKLTKHKGDTAELAYALTDTPTYTDEEEGETIVDYSITQVKGHQDEVSQLERAVSNIEKGYNGVMNKSEFLEEENKTEVNILPACILKNEKGIISGKKIYNEDQDQDPSSNTELQEQDPSSNTEKEGHTDDLENTTDSNTVCLGRMQLRDMPEETQMLAETICVPDGARNKDTVVSEAINDKKEQTWDTKGQEVGVISEKLSKSSSSIYSNQGNNSGIAEGEVQLTQIMNFDLELQEKEEGYSGVNSKANYEETEGRGQNKENFNKMLPKEEKIQEKFQAKIVGLVESDEPRHVTKELDVLTLKCSPILIQVDDTLPDKLGMTQKICEFRDEVKEEEDQREGRGEDDHTMNSDSSLLGAGGKQPKLEEGYPIEKMLQVKLDTGHGMNEEIKEEAEQRETKGKHDQNMGYEFSKQGGESDGINLGTEINVDEMLPAELTKFTADKGGEERREHGEGGGKDECDMNSVFSLQGKNSNDLSINEGIQVEQMLHIKVDIKHEINEVKKVEVEKLEGREASEKGISNNENLDQDSSSNNEKQVHKGDLEMTSDSEKVTLGEARKEEAEQSEAKGKYDHKLHYDTSIQGEETNETKHGKEINVDEALPAKRKETLIICKEEEEWGEYREGTEMEEQDMNFGFSTQGETSNYLNIDGEKPLHVKLDNDLGMSEVKHAQMEQTEGRKKEKELKKGKCPLQEGDSSEAKVEDIHVDETLPTKWEMTLEMCDLYGKETKQRQERETDDRELRHGSSLQRSLLKEMSVDKTLPANLNVAEEICENKEKKEEDEWSEEKCNQQPHEGKSKEQNLEGETVVEKTLQVNVDIELEMNKVNQEEHEEVRRKEDVEVNYESHLQEGDCEEIVLGKEIHVDETSTAIAKTVLTGSEVKEDEVEHKEERKSNERDMESGHDQNTDKGINMEERLQVSVNIELVKSEAEQEGKTGEENEPNNGESSFQGGEGNKAKLGEDLYVIKILSDQKEGSRKHEQELKYESSLQAGAGSKVKCEEEEEVEELLQTKLDMAPVIPEVKEVGKSEETGKENQKETIMYTKREQMQEESELPKLCRSTGLDASLKDDHKRETHERGREESVHEKVVHDDEGRKMGFNAKEPEDHEENMQVKVKLQGNEGVTTGKSSVLEDENEVLHEVHDGEIFNKVRKEEGTFHETQNLQDQLLPQDEVVHKGYNEPTAIKSFGIPEDCQETMVAMREHHMGSNEMVEGDVQGFGWKMEITHELMEACEKGTGKNQKETVEFRDVQNKNRDEYCSASREDARDEILKHIGTENNTGEKMVPCMENLLENSDLKYGDINDTNKEDLMRVDDALEDSRIPLNEDLKNDAEHNPRSMEDSAGERDQTLEWEETKTQNEDFKWWEDIKNRSWEELLEAENPQKQKDKCNSQEETVQGEKEGGEIYKYKIITYKNTNIQEERIEQEKQDVEGKVEKSRTVDQPSASSKGEYKKSERKNIHGLPFATAEWDRRADLKKAMSESKELDEQQRSEEDQGPQQQGATFNLSQEVEEAVLLHTRRTDEIVLLTDEKGGQPQWATEEKSSERITDPKEFKEVCQNEKQTIASSPNAEVPGRVKYPESERSTKRMKRSQEDEERQLSTGQKAPREGEDMSQPVKLNRDDVEELMANSGLSQKPDKLYNVVFIGESSVGKTSFIKKFCNGVFRLDLCATVGIDSCLRSLTVEGEQFVLQLWDTAGQERYHSITKQIFRKADGVVVMYDVTSSCTYVAVRYWLSCIEEGTNGDLPVLLLGNKTDITEKREVQIQEGGSLANEYGFHFMECSAASGHNVNESMASLARALKEKEDMMKENANVVEVTPKKSSCC